MWRYREIKESQLKAQDSQIVNSTWPYPFVVNAFYEADDNSIGIIYLLIFNRNIVQLQ